MNTSGIRFIAPMVRHLVSPEQEEAFSLFAQAIQRFGNDIVRRVASNVREIIIDAPDGKLTLDDLASRTLASGDIIMVWTTWERASRRKGFYICDGRNGTPPIHPAPNSSLPPRFVRASPWGVSPIGPPARTGGSDCHYHNLSIANHSFTLPQHEQAHAHLHNLCTLVSTACVIAACCAYGAPVSLATHTHVIDGGICPCTLVLPHQEQTLCHCISFAMASHLPPYVEAIFLMKG